MKLEDQVVSLELSQKLSELGVKCDSYFCCFHAGIAVERWWLSDTHPESEVIPAYTVAELGSMLPTDIGKWMLCASKSQGGWVMSYEDSCFKRLDGVGIFREIEADARAKMLVYLIENGHLSVEEVNCG